MRLQVRLCLLVAVLVTTVGLVSALFVNHDLVKALQEDYYHLASSVTAGVAESLSRDVLAQKDLSVAEALAVLVKRESDIVYAYIVDFDGRIASHTFGAGFPAALLQLEPVTDASPYRVYREGDRRILHTEVPLIKGLRARLHMGFDRIGLERRIATTQKRLLVVTLVVVVLGVLAGFWFSQRLVGPLALVADRLDRYGRDEATLPIEAGASEGPVGQIVDSFNAMLAERSEKDRQLQESEQYSRTLFESLPVGLALTRMDGQLVDVNPAFAGIIGRTVEETVQLTYWQITPEEYRAQEQEQLRLLNEHGRYGPYEKEYLHADGHRLPVRLSGQVIHRHGEAFIWSSVEEISDRKRLDSERQARERRLLSYQEALAGLGRSQAVKQSLLEDVYKEVTETAARIMDISRVGIWLYTEEREGIRCIDLYEKEKASHSSGTLLLQKDYPSYFSALREDRVVSADDAGRDPATREFRQTYLEPQGITSMMDVPLRVAGKPIGVLCHEHVGPLRHWSLDEQTFAGSLADLVSLSLEIAAHKEAQRELAHHRDQLEELVSQRTEELEAVNAELESFAYSVSHDLRSPLRAIDGFSELLLVDYAERLDDNGKDSLLRVRKAAQRMGLLIDDLLQLSKVARSELVFKALDLTAVANKVVAALRELHPEREVEVQVAAAMQVVGDPTLVYLLMENLLSNAWKYTSRISPACIEVGIAADRDNPPVFYVKDNGAGFDMAYAGKLFTPFQRLHGRDEFEGTGVGLATVKRIVSRHGGEVWVKAEPGKGACFYFTLSGQARA